MPRENTSAGGEITIDPFYPDGYASSDHDLAQIIAQKEKYAASVNSINFKACLIASPVVNTRNSVSKSWLCNKT